MSAILINNKNKVTVFKQMTHAWQKLIELLIALPIICDWFGHIDLVISIIRITGALYNIDTVNERKRIQEIMKPILKLS